MFFKAITLLLLAFIAAISLSKVVIKLAEKLLSPINYKFTNTFSLLMECILVFIVSVFLGQKMIYIILFL